LVSFLLLLERWWWGVINRRLGSLKAWGRLFELWVNWSEFWGEIGFDEFDIIAIFTRMDVWDICARIMIER